MSHVHLLLDAIRHGRTTLCDLFSTDKAHYAPLLSRLLT